ncbi:MAG: cysteine--tRNA ligase [Thermoplasmata archaeon]
MGLKLYNTLARAKEEFEPLQGRRVKMFVCGITPYDHTHIGHARTYVAFDVIARYLRHRGYSLFYLQNVTDVDDRILTRAPEVDIPWDDLGDEYLADYLKTMEALGVTSVNLYAKATDYIPEIIEQVEGLLAGDYAYQVDGDVFYQISSFQDYGKLSRVKLEKLRSGARVEVDKRKRNPQDFALWKSRKPGEPHWDSPWGAGRPGWHIEDTAISVTHFGPQYDIHGAGNDLIFPHHEAEIAQAEAFTGRKPFVKYWMHTGFVVIKGERMGKSLGNIIPVKEVLERYDPEVLRFFLVYTQYRSPIDFTYEALEEARRAYGRITEALERARAELSEAREERGDGDEELRGAIASASSDFFEAMDDDFNTRDALAALFSLTSTFRVDLGRGLSAGSLREFLDAFETYGTILGLFRGVAAPSVDLIDGLIGLLLRLREDARRGGDYEASDRIRKELTKLGVRLEDTSKGPRWRLP